MKKTLLLISISCFTHVVFAQFVLNGDAALLGGDCYQLTLDETFSAGSIWYESLVSLDTAFDLNFSIYLGTKDDNGADGVYFVLQPVSTGLGAAGGGMGYEGITPSLGVEFDTYQNGEYNDPAYDHIAITSNGDLNHADATNLAGPVQILSASPNAEDGNTHEVKITWDPDAQKISAYVDCDLRVSYTGDIITDLFGGDPHVYFGFTGGTGSLSNVQRVCFEYTSEIDALADASICPGDSVQLTVPSGFASYLWLPNTDISNNTINNPWFSPSDTTTYTVTITDACGFAIYDTVNINVGNPTLVNLGPDLTLCDGQTYTLNAYTAGATYLWSNGSTGPTLTVSAAGSYWVGVTKGSCFDEDTITVNYEPAPNINLGPDTTMCGLGSPLYLNATTAGATYLWQDGSTGPNFTVTTDGDYYVTVSIGGCTDRDTVYVNYTASPYIDLGPDFKICPGLTQPLYAGSPDLVYLWQDGSTNNTYTVTGPGIYWAQITVNGCSSIDTVNVTLDPCECTVTVPNAFSPNGDGINDEIKQVDCTYFLDFYFHIYNRWGQMVFSTTDPNQAWDGTFNNKASDVGTYVYTIHYKRVTGEEGDVSGNFELIR